MNKKMIVITGGDSGIGESLARKLSGSTATVVVSFLAANVFTDNKNIVARKMDLRIEEEIERFGDTIADMVHAGYELECFIHNAGIAFGGPVENLPVKIYREVMEVNFFGIVTLTRKVLPQLIKCRSKLFIVGSLAGKIAAPYLSPYVASKFALEGYTDSLRRELNPFGITTVLFEPSGVATPIWKKYDSIDLSFIDNKYKKSLEVFKKKFIDQAAFSLPCGRAADFIIKILIVKNPKTRYIIAKDWLVSQLLLRLPDKILDTLIRSTYQMNYGK
jgi:NAD(P)-dependent dehydrogenase (short-subunit alcohol dehydrogenase family)